ncbi:MAG: hypothetical protein Q8O67_02135 [Deltaproteobacteria bacterium]|nr:hypothetical protein [Deltaproteobacteria bacterium]
MRQTSLFLGLALLLGCPRAVDGPAALERPAPPTTGTADARVLHVVPSVDVVPVEGAPFTARAGLDLVRSDVLRPAASSMIIVLLRNGHAVRVDDAGPLAVKDMLLIDAAPTTTPAEEQLIALLDPGEGGVPAEVRERAAAWRQMTRAAESAGASAQDAPSEAMQKANAVTTPEAPPAPPPPTNEDRQEPKPDPEPKKPQTPPPPQQPRPPFSGGAPERHAKKDAAKTESNQPSGGEMDDAAKEEARKRIAALGLLKVMGSQGEGGELKNVFGGVSGVGIADALATTTWIARFGPTPANATTVPVPGAFEGAVASTLTTCLRDELGKLGLKPASVELRFEVKGTKLARVRLGGGLPTPTCAKQAVAAVVVDNADGWLVITVPL